MRLSNPTAFAAHNPQYQFTITPKRSKNYWVYRPPIFRSSSTVESSDPLSGYLQIVS
ncbi:hypothetical protein BDW69DRAFT_80163 [Aspergillus filifer]